MALVLKEAINSRSFTEGWRENRLERSMEVIYYITGSDDPSSPAVLALGPQNGDAHPTNGTLGYVTGRRIEVMQLVTASQPGLLKLVVTYSPPERLPNQSQDDPEYELNLMAETAHIESAINHYDYPSDIHNVRTSIGANGQDVKGVDIYVPKGVYSETRDRMSLLKSYRATLMQMAGTVNNYAFKGWNPGEVLFLGATARRKGFGAWKMQYQFSIQSNTKQVIQTTSGAQTFTKNGWDYMWFERVQKDDGTGTGIIRDIEVVHVDQVYPYTDFSVLGIGTT